MLHSTTLAFTATRCRTFSATYTSFEAFGVAGLIYADVVFVLIALFRRLESRWLAYLHR